MLISRKTKTALQVSIHCRNTPPSFPEHLRFASIHEMSAVTSLPRGTHARTPAATNHYRSLDVQTRLVGVVYWNPSRTCKDLRCVLHLMP
jgi:hypothetical protein